MSGEQRPYVKVREYTWKDRSGREVPGLSLWRRNLVAHLTYDEARDLADKLHDLVDAASHTTTESR
ncbi:hypothetical protein [Paenarthrobacter sp. Y-19]|uniref:hypothetical protein n=1 Tax=Paenarthrobacter sp. Y-19 TaxID=3031125 RepID=UPI0023DC7F63|nr:hypothetical protein [Paenarthrobacter sp. Y-19]